MSTATITDGPWEINPQLIPAVAGDIHTGDCHIREIHLVNETATAATVTITDKQSPARMVVPAISVPANSDQIWEFTGRLCPGGITWVASAANTITGFLKGTA